MHPFKFRAFKRRNRDHRSRSSSLKDVKGVFGSTQLVLRSENYRNTVDSLYFTPGILAVTANDANYGIGILAKSAADIFSRLSIAFRGYGAGVYKINVADLVKGCSRKAQLLKPFCYCLGLVKRNLTSEGV